MSNSSTTRSKTKALKQNIISSILTSDVLKVVLILVLYEALLIVKPLAICYGCQENCVGIHSSVFWAVC